jgi:hypothetical protein
MLKSKNLYIDIPDDLMAMYKTVEAVIISKRKPSKGLIVFSYMNEENRPAVVLYALQVTKPSTYIVKHEVENFQFMNSRQKNNFIKQLNKGTMLHFLLHWGERQNKMKKSKN